MTIESIPGTAERYYLVSFDEKGRERDDDPDSLMSHVVIEAVRSEAPTDVFVFIHGWKGDVPAAREQYGKWMGAVVALADHRAWAGRVRPGFKPLFVGLHWPSLPFGDETITDGMPGMAFGLNNSANDVDEDLIERCAAQIADTAPARAALRTIFAAAQDDIAPATLPEAVRDAYLVLDREAGLSGEGAGGDPGGDREPFDPDAAYADALEESASFAGGLVGGLLSPLVQLSFWKMKDRARKFGESGGFAFLEALMGAGGERDMRVHIMGHSFGCAAASACATGPAGKALPRPVHSMVLVQGALSLWSYCDNIPHAPGKAGYFRRLIADRRVAGPIVTTQSSRDTAVGKLYPVAAGAARQIDFPAGLPRYGGLGAFGIQGPGLEIVELRALPASAAYSFAPGEVYNIDCVDYIREGGPPSGAHSDIAKPEVAHLVWSAALVNADGIAVKPPSSGIAA